MKKYSLYLILFFTFLFLYFGIDLVYCYLIKKDSILSEEIILKSDYNALNEKYTTLLNSHDLWEGKNDFITSKVVSRDPYNIDEITILKGSEDGVKTGDTIINEYGLVGIVSNVKKHVSFVKTINHKDTNISVKVGKLYGMLKKDDDKLIIEDIKTKDSDLVGAFVKTSGFTSVPEDILVGEVSSVIDNGLTISLVVIPSADLNNLNYCFIRSSVVYE